MLEIHAWQPKNLRLGEEERKTLLELCANDELWIRQTPGQRDAYEPLFTIENASTDRQLRVKAGPYAGSIKVIDTEIRINPPSELKDLSPQHLIRMLMLAVGDQPKAEFLNDFPVANNFSWDGFVEPVYAAFARSLDRSLRKGVYRDYQTTKQIAPVLRGRVNWSKQVELISKGQAKFATEHETFSRRNPINALLSQACRVVQMKTAESRVFAMVRKCQTMLPSDVTRFTNIGRIPRRASYLSEAIDVGTIILSDLGISDRGEAGSIAGFVINLFDLFEKFLAAALRQKDSNYGFQQQLALHSQSSKWKYFGYPDLVYNDGNRAACIIDAKFKNIGIRGPIASDLYQLYTYVRCAGLDFGLLVYPVNGSNTARNRTFKMRIGDTGEVDIVTYGLPITPELTNSNPYQACIDQLHDFIIQEMNKRTLP